MDFLRNVSVSGEYQAPTASLDDLFPTQNTEVDVSLEWLSIFVEDCFSSTGNCIPVSNVETKAAKPAKNVTKSAEKPHLITPPSLQKLVVPGKARSKRKRVSSSITTSVSKTKNNPIFSWSCNMQPSNSDPLLLQQSCWLADSELIFPKKEDDSSSGSGSGVKEGMEEEKASAVQQQQQPRRCSHCLAQRTPRGGQDHWGQRRCVMHVG